MKKISILLVIALILTTCLAGCKKADNTATLEVPEIKYEVPEWYRDAKFGIFIHYGVYSVPAYGDEWYGHWMYIPDGDTYGGDNIYTHHLNTYGGPEKFGYKDFIPDFLDGLTRWQNSGGAEQWAELFEKAGAKYVVPVGIHHDSYALYNSDIQKTYNSVNGAGIDYIGELKDAVTARGIKFGVSNHFAENDWFFDEESGKNTDLADSQYEELYGVPGSKTEAHIEKWYGISMEIIEKYRPDLIYYDFDLQDDAFNRYKDANRYLMLQNYYDLAKSWDGNEGVVCNYKHSAFTQKMAVLDKEREALGAISPIAWQTDTSVGAKSWGYIADEEYRSGEEFITALIDIVSKNGNLLLNVNPMADGTIPEETQEILETIGAWLGTYGDAIYATRPWTVYGEGETENSGDSYQYTGSDIRFTRSKDSTHLYISALDTPDNQTISVKTLNKGSWNAGEIESICFINGSERTPLAWDQTDEALEITIPEGIEGACAVDVTFKNGGTIPKLMLNASDTIQAVEETEFLLNFGGDETAIAAEVTCEKSGKISVSIDGAEAIDLDFLGVDGTQIVTADCPALSGAHAVSFEASDGIKLSEFTFCKTIFADAQIEAESFNLAKGNVRAEDCAEGGQNLGYVSEGDYVCYGAVDFGSGKTKLSVRLAGSGQSCNIRLDSPDGEIICTAGGEDTGGWSEYKTLDYEIKKISGVHSLYITYDTGWSDVNVNWLNFS